MSRTQSTSRGHAVVDLGSLQPVEWKSKTEFAVEGDAAQLTEQMPLRVVVSSSDAMTNR
jgi:hypothetical protein